MLAIAWFEFRTRLKRISTYVYFVSFAAVAALWMAAVRLPSRGRRFISVT